MNARLLDRISLIIAAAILFATMMSFLFTLDHFGLEEWYGFAAGVIFYLGTTYHLIFKNYTEERQTQAKTIDRIVVPYSPYHLTCFRGTILQVRAANWARLHLAIYGRRHVHVFCNNLLLRILDTALRN